MKDLAVDKFINDLKEVIWLFYERSDSENITFGLIGYIFGFLFFVMLIVGFITK